MIRNPQRGFSLLELLMVVAVIAVLLALLAPGISGFSNKARVARCRANLRDTYVAISRYHADHRNAPNPDQQHRMPEFAWRFSNGSGDYPHESGRVRGLPGTVGRALFNNGYIEDPGQLFCPLAPVTAEIHFNPAPSHNYKTFSGSYTWAWRTVLRADDVHDGINANQLRFVTDPGREVMYYDTLESSWKRWANDTYRYEHYNVLFATGSVRKVAETADGMAEFLWGSKKRPY